jgi:hypothetical protein
MKPPESAEALARHLRRAGGVESASLGDLISAAIQFYTDCPASGLSEEVGSDMLLFQYGCHDWGDGVMFEVDLTRQFIVADEDGDDAISQLHFTAYFEPDDELRVIGSHNRWCMSHDEVAEFRNEVLNSPALALAAKRHRREARVEWENV